jgi:uncharacterized pyridoxamine 5'-phosphate oxidase family protein
MDILKFFQENYVYYLATIENGKPKVRPMSFLMDVGGKLSFCTGMQKAMFKQMEKTPEVEICSLSREDGWLRISGRVSFNKTPEARQKWLDAAEHLVHLYKDKYDMLVVCSFDTAVVEYQPDERKGPPDLDETWKKESDCEGFVLYRKTI